MNKWNASRYAAANPFMLWTGLALKTGEMMMASAQVINHRTGRIAAAGVIPSQRDQKEFTLMGQEKIEAAAESVQAIASRMVSLNQQIGAIAFRQIMAGATGWMSLATGVNMARTSQLQQKFLHDTMSNSAEAATHIANSVARVAHTGLRPIHSRATANAKRLGKLAG